MTKNYIFDFGNVLARFSPPAMTAAVVKEPADAATVCAVVFDRQYWDKLDEGTLSDEAVRDAIRARLPQRLHAPALYIYDHWWELLTPVDGMPALVADIKAAGGRLFLLSNISTAFAAHYGDVAWIRALFAQFDGLVFSAPLGLVKPQRPIFEHLLTRYALRAEDCLFIDDLPRNLDGARAVGIAGYLFDGDAEKLRKSLNS